MLKKSSLVSALLALICALSLPVSAAAIAVSAESACLICADTGDIVFEKNADKPLPMASTTKIMTCLAALENGVLTDKVTVDSRAVGIEGTSLYLAKGDVISLEDLLYALMLRSANDAACAVACHISGSPEAFVSLMNEKASSLGLENTRFANPHGLPDEGHYTTARDYAVLTVYAMKNEVFRRIVSSPSHTVILNGSEKRYVTNHNRLLGTYDGANGVKTGFTRSSGRCLVSSACREGVNLIAVTLNAPSDWSDHAKMLDFGFTQYSHETLLEKGEIRYSLSVFGHGEVILTNRDEVSLTHKNGSEKTVKLFAPKMAFAPVIVGIPMGKAVVFIDGKAVSEVLLYPDKSVWETSGKSFFEKIKGGLSAR